MRDREPPEIKDKVTIADEAYRLYDLKEEARLRGYSHIRTVDFELDDDLEEEMKHYRNNRKNRDFIFFMGAAILGGSMLAVLLLAAVLSLLPI